MDNRLVYKVADEPREFEQIHALNYRTFVEEIPQHAGNGARRHVDRFHAENTYIICRAGDELAGMVALRGSRPFSLDGKLRSLDSYLPQGRRACEIRLLAVEKRYRKTSVFAGLVARLVQVARARGYDLALISGTVRQLKLYRHLGFEPFGPLVGPAEAQYQPMMLTLERFQRCTRALFHAKSYLPGPVATRERVREKLAEPALSHRGERFRAVLEDVQSKLKRLTGARHVSVALGSGTLANDMIGAQLDARGIVLSNGEFGERLVDHAHRWGLEFDILRSPWGRPFDLRELRLRLERRPRWLWFAHCETSTGVLNDLEAIKALCARSSTEVCVDAVSSLGTVPCNLAGVAFASGVSGKGLAAYPGIALVMHREAPRPSRRVPRYLDLALYCGGEVPFTQSSNLLGALNAALDDAGPRRYETLREDVRFLRQRLEAAGLPCVAPAEHAAPAVVTVALPPSASSLRVARRLAEAGFVVAHASRYLLESNWIQIALMGEYSREGLSGLVDALEETIGVVNV
jgi:aspartate aminotransferase-like enzyme/GNAT superfamily N-acetyltransferase